MIPSEESLERDPLIRPEDEDYAYEDDPKLPQKKSRHNHFILCIALSCTIVGIACGVLFMILTRHDPESRTACANPSYRQEWRDLSERQKQDYLTAVLCLKSTPSRLGMNQSLWEDFPWVHALVGGYCA